MKNKFKEFVELHKNTEPLLIGNVWDVQSAKLFEQQNYSAIATSSAAMAATLGYTDDQDMKFDEYLLIIKRITTAVSIPFSVDIEAGYENTPKAICDNIIALYEAGVSGINIEDSLVSKGKRTIVDAEAFAEKLRWIVKLLKTDNINMFINVRSDSFMLGLPNALADALSRVNIYQDTGVHGLFFPCITKIEDIRTITASSKLPINVMCMSELPDFHQLKEAGVKRISFGPFLHNKIYKQMEGFITQIDVDKNFGNLF